MSQHYYIKLYFEILSDRKMCRLPDRSWRRIIELFLLAGAHKWSNELPTVEDMAWELRIDPDELLSDLREVEKTGIIKETEPGKWIVTNFENRQDAETGAERIKRYREQKRKQIYKSNDVSNETLHEGVTNDVPELRVKAIVKVKEEGAADQYSIVQSTIEKLIGYPITPNTENINAINEFIKMGATEDDFRGAIAYLTGTGKVIRSSSALLGSVRTEVAKRTQRKNGKPEKQFIPEEHASEVYGGS